MADWKCSVCETINSESLPCCEVCGNPKPEVTASHEGTNTVTNAVNKDSGTVNTDRDLRTMTGLGEGFPDRNGKNEYGSKEEGKENNTFFAVFLGILLIVFFVFVILGMRGN